MAMTAQLGLDQPWVWGGGGLFSVPEVVAVPCFIYYSQVPQATHLL